MRGISSVTKVSVAVIVRNTRRLIVDVQWFGNTAAYCLECRNGTRSRMDDMTVTLVRRTPDLSQLMRIRFAVRIVARNIGAALEAA